MTREREPVEVAIFAVEADDTVVGILKLAAAMAALGLLYQRVGRARHRRRYPPPGELIDVGGHRLHVTCAGRGSPVVLLESAIAASSLSWSIVQPEIARLTRVCTYDRAGLAWSERSSCPRTFERIVDELSIVLARVAPDARYVLVGHSFGSFVVSAFAARHPEQIVGVVLVDPALEWLTSTRQRARLLWGARQLSRIGALLAHLGVVRACLALLTGGAPGAPRRFVRIFGPTAAHTLERMVGEVRKLPPAVHPFVQAHWCEPKCFQAMAEHFQTLERDRDAIVKVIPPRGVPVTVISSGGQPQDQLEAHRRLADASPNGRHMVASRSAHWIQFDEPELVIEAVRDLVLKRRALTPKDPCSSTYATG